MFTFGPWPASRVWGSPAWLYCAIFDRVLTKAVTIFRVKQDFIAFMCERIDGGRGDGLVGK